MAIRDWMAVPFLVCLVVPTVASATDCAPLSTSWPGQQSADFINLVNSTPFSWITGAATKWNQACDVDQVPFLELSSGHDPNDFNVDINYIPGRNPNPPVNGVGGGCGRTGFFPSGGSLGSAVIEIYDQDFGGESCSREDTLTHELGHVFGLGDTIDLSCANSLMWGGRGGGTTVSANDCAKADSQWFTSWESPDPCDTPNPPQGCDPYEQGPGSPIIIDLDGDGMPLTGPDDPVSFDIDDDGLQETLSWTSAEAFDAFLYLDRNENGRVDSGAELFGNYTPLIDGSTAANGYIPLAEFDLVALGGNGNGFIDEQDVIYQELRLWIDWDHDGQSEASELLTLAGAGVSRIDLQYRTSRRRDRYGNEFRYISRAWMLVHGRERPVWTSDVFFVID